ncbi:nucleolar protein 7 [Parus major]|uniref:nucleolar protein 7 n=1 Tax=Parus major TaxID=9157 RepID=UPI00077116A5|nr:nucleolar protein 7 [Parus major]
MVRRQKAKVAAGGKRRAPAALPSPASSSEDEADEAPEEVPFGVAREAAEAERKLAGEAARRHRELLKEKRRRHQELFAEQKKRRLLPEAVLQELQELQDVSARPTEQAVADDPGEELEAGAVQLEQGHDEVQEKKGKRRKGARTKGNYMAVCLKDDSVTGLHQQLAKDFLNAQLYGPHTNRVQASEFFSFANKRDPVKKAAVQFVDKSWGQDKKEKAARFKKRWLATQVKNGV